jgi:hypothetical protein
MVAQKIDGTAIAKGVREKLNAQIREKQEKNPRYKPSLIIIQGMLERSHVQVVTILMPWCSGGPIRL